jgi:hypothetical protein
MTGAQLDSFGAGAFHSDIACVHVTREHSRPFKHGTLFPFLAKDPLLDSGQPGVGAVLFAPNCEVAALRHRLFRVGQIDWRVNGKGRRVSKVIYSITAGHDDKSNMHICFEQSSKR